MGGAWKGVKTQASPAEVELQRAEAMRERMLARKATILDPKKRMFGVDTAAWEQQIADKRIRAQREKSREDNFDLQTLQHQTQLLQGEERYNALVRQRDKDDVQFRATDQLPQGQREFDIWRRDKLKVSQPARIGDDDPRLGPASGQVYGGEDLKISQRLAAQGAQRREWLEAQVTEHKERQKQAMIDQLESDLADLEAQKVVNEAAAKDAAGRRAVREDIRDENARLEALRAERARLAREAEQAANASEIAHTLATPEIVERMGVRGEMPQDFRGLTLEEQKVVLDGQRLQMEESAKRRDAERALKESWDRRELALKAEGDLAEAEHLRRREQVSRDLGEFHRKQAVEQIGQERYRNRELYRSNIPTDAYYNQWGRDVR